jgi:hypothetical protein
MVKKCRVFTLAQKNKKPPSAAKGREHQASAVPPDFSEKFRNTQILPVTGLTVRCYFVSQRPLQSERRIATSAPLSASSELSVNPFLQIAAFSQRFLNHMF